MLYVTLSEILKIAMVWLEMTNEDPTDYDPLCFATYKKDGVWRNPMVNFAGRHDKNKQAWCDCSEFSYCRCSEEWEDEELYDTRIYDPRIYDRYSEMAERCQVDKHLGWSFDNDDDLEAWADCLLGTEDPEYDEDVQDTLFPPLKPNDGYRGHMSTPPKHTSWKRGKSRKRQFYPTS